MRKPLFKAAIALTAAMMIQAPAQAAEYTLRFAHFWPAVAGLNKHIYQVWADKVEKESGGRIEVEIYPSSTLAKPPAQYDAVKNRIADITATVPGYSANRFPLSQLVELPGIAENATSGSCIIQGLYDEGLINQEFKDTKPLFLWTHGLGQVHTREAVIKVPADLEGLRIRRPTAVVAKILEGLGAQPVGMPAPSAYQSVQRGVIDGVALAWDAMLTFRLNELTPKHTEVGGLYTLAFVVTMNKDVYNDMPADLQKVIDNNSGAEWSNMAAEVYEEGDAKARAQAVELGHEIYTVEGGVSNPDWKPVLDQASEGYLAELEAKGLPARKVYARAQELSKTCK